jgi:hypothetical protein
MAIFKTRKQKMLEKRKINIGKTRIRRKMKRKRFLFFGNNNLATKLLIFTL